MVRKKLMTEKIEALRLLKKYQKEVNVLLREYFSQERKEAGSIDRVASNSIQSIEKFVMAGGKRLRPALLYYGYLASGGRKLKAVRKASLSIELIHSFLLIHDDIMDRDVKRHGVDTIHQEYAKLARKMFPVKNWEHYGQSMGIVIGDLCYTLGNKVLFQADFPAEIILQALLKLQNIVYEVIPGQIRDVTMGFSGKFDEEEILKVQEAKTAYYTFDGPIQLGCILAENKDKDMLKYFTKYSLFLGKAFQIRDDILGIFGDEKILGKPIGSDIVEGKKTLLIDYIFRSGTTKDKEIIKSVLGKEKITIKELNQVRDIIRDSGSLSYSQKKAEFFVAEALDNLNQIYFKNKISKKFFRGIAQYIIERLV